MTDKRRPKANPLVVAAGLAVLALAVVVAGRGVTQWYSTRCGAQISYDNQMHDFKTSAELLELESASRTAAGRELSETLQLYLDQARRYCELHRSGGMSDEAYRNAVEQLGQRFGDLVSLQQETPAHELTGGAVELYTETLATLRRETPAEGLGFGFRVVSDGRPLRSGSTLHSGDTFHLEVEVPQTAYLYAILLNSADEVSRLYPSEPTGSENPVQGWLRIPAERSFELDDGIGIEKILVFAQRDPSPPIEHEIGEIGSEPRPDASAALQAAFRSRGVFVQPPEPDTGDFDRVLSRIGQPAVEFLIDHRRPG